MTRTNKFPGKCASCNTQVGEKEGYIFRGSRGWNVSCNGSKCLEANGLLEDVKETVKKAERREITADGKVFFPYDANVVKLVKSLPGARWNPTDRHWTIDMDPAFAKRILEVAEKCRLQVPDGLVNIRNPLVDIALARAKAANAYPYQEEGVEWLVQMQYAVLGDDMGLGKTWQALLAMDASRGIICIVPSSVKYNWQQECNELRPEITTTVLKGKKSFRLPEPGEMVILNPEILPAWLKPTAITCVPWKVEDGVRDLSTNCRFCVDGTSGSGEPCKKCKGSGIAKKFHYLVPVVPEEFQAQLDNCFVIADECHMYKNYKALRSKKVGALVNLVAGAWGLTGTPMLNRPLDLWGVLQVFNLTRLCFGGYRTFERLYGAYKGRFGTEWGAPSDEVPERLRAGMLRRMKREVLPDLPPKTYQDIVVEINDRDLRKEMDRMAADVDCVFTDMDLADMMLAFEDGSQFDLPPFEEFSAIRAKLAEDRIPALLEIIETYEDAGKPVVVVSAHRAPVDTLGQRQGWATITGSTDPEERQRITNAFQNGEYLGVALTITVAIGMTLTRADHMIFVDFDWTPALNTQAEDRINRIGQKSGATVYKRLRSNHPLDLHIHNLLAFKIALIHASLDTEIEVDEAAFETSGPGIREDDDASYKARMAEIKSERERVEREAREAKVKTIKNERVPVWLQRMTERADRPELDLSIQENAETVRRAFYYMESVCDGAKVKDGRGFNKPDALIAALLCSTGMQEEDELRIAERMLSRYHRQLHDQFPTLFA